MSDSESDSSSMLSVNYDELNGALDENLNMEEFNEACKSKESFYYGLS